jgi:hypothetical protein
MAPWDGGGGVHEHHLKGNMRRHRAGIRAGSRKKPVVPEKTEAVARPVTRTRATAWRRARRCQRAHPAHLQREAHAQKPTMPMRVDEKFIAIVWATFLARTSPVSTSANPACMNITRKPATSVQHQVDGHRSFPESLAGPSSSPLLQEKPFHSSRRSLTAFAATTAPSPLHGRCEGSLVASGRLLRPMGAAGSPQEGGQPTSRQVDAPSYSRRACSHFGQRTGTH